MNLSKDQIYLITRIWKKEDFDWLFEVGMNIYCEIFHLEPEVKVIFPYIIECEEQQKDVKESKQFRAQALRFVQVLERAVSCISDNEPTINEFDDYLYQLGHRHQAFAVRGFKPEYWDIFDLAVVRVIEKEYVNCVPKMSDLQKKSAMEAWRILSDYIIEGMKKGFIVNDSISSVSPTPGRKV